MEISNVLKIGDVVFSTCNGKPMIVTEMDDCGFFADDDYYSFEEHRKLFFLTKVGYLDYIEERKYKNGN